MIRLLPIFCTALLGGIVGGLIGTILLRLLRDRRR